MPEDEAEDNMSRPRSRPRTKFWPRGQSGLEDLTSLIDSNIKSIGLLLKFADDTKVFAKVSNMADRQRLQDDLNELCDWAKTWQMEFNVAKCVTMHIGRRISEFTYSMQGRELSTVTTTKDLGVHLTNDLKSAEHCYESHCKADRMLGMLKRTIKHKETEI